MMGRVGEWGGESWSGVGQRGGNVGKVGGVGKWNCWGQKSRLGSGDGQNGGNNDLQEIQSFIENKFKCARFEFLC